MDQVIIKEKKTLIAACFLSLFLMWIAPSHVMGQTAPDPVKKGKILYENDLSDAAQLKNWIMEGPGHTVFEEGWMHLYAPDEEWHHVLWCPEDFPESFIAEWEMQNMHPEAGLCIVFFATTGLDGEDVFDSSLAPRDGTFRQYTKEQIQGYHISYYANNPKNREREASHLRKNNMFEIVAVGPEGIPKHSSDIHHIQLVKKGPHIIMSVDGNKIIDWTDDEKLGPTHTGGKIGFRQMQWSHFRYRNFKVWEHEN